MAQEHEQHGAELTHGHHGPRALPSMLMAPDAVKAWRMRAIIVAVVFGLLSLVFLFFGSEGRNHLLRAYLMGVMTCFNFVGGALAFLLVQYVSGGKWGAVLRRPLEAMTRTAWVVAVMFLPILFLGKHLYQWWAYPNAAATWNAYKSGIMSQEQMLTANAKRAMLSPTAAVVQYLLV